MAATVSAWGTKPGAWALDAEEHEEELQQERKAMEQQQQQQQSKYSVASAVEASDFPSLSAAVATKGKKKKGQTLSLGEFSNYSGAKTNRLTNEDLIKLPTGPRERSAEEMMEGGRGFRSYGMMGRSDGGGDRWSRGGDGEGRRESREPLGPSRADEIDNWAIGKKSVGGIGGGGGGGGFERRERSGGSFFGSDSKADESDSWVSKKSFAPSDAPMRSGFERERRSYEPFTANSGGADGDTWGRKREERVADVSVGGRPKLNLQRRTLPVTVERPQSPNVDVELVKPQPQPQSPEIVIKPRSFNPFGEARPREEVLAEKGQDWKKIDEQLDTLKVKEIGAEESDRPGSAKKGFGWRGSPGEEKTERSWRKPEPADDARPISADKPAENNDGTPVEK